MNSPAHVSRGILHGNGKTGIVCEPPGQDRAAVSHIKAPVRLGTGAAWFCWRKQGLQAGGFLDHGFQSGVAKGFHLLAVGIPLVKAHVTGDELGPHFILVGVQLLRPASPHFRAVVRSVAPWPARMKIPGISPLANIMLTRSVVWGLCSIYSQSMWILVRFSSSSNKGMVSHATWPG